MVKVTNYKWRGYDENERKIAIYGSWWFAGIIVGQFVFSPVQAEVASQEPDDIIHHGHGYFKSITCESLEVVEPAKGRTAISLYHTNKGNGTINVYNTKIPVRDRSQPPAVSLKAGDDNSGSLAIFNKFGENIVVLSKLKASDSGQVFVTDKQGEIISALVPTGVATAEEAKR